MTLNDYQEKAMATCMSTSANFAYMFLNLVGEVGEFASKVAKAIRKDQMDIDGNCLYRFKAPEESDNELKKEAGDILWQLSGLCTMMGWDFEDVAAMNLEKLSQRKQNGTIDGSGDGVSKEDRL